MSGRGARFAFTATLRWALTVAVGAASALAVQGAEAAGLMWEAEWQATSGGQKEIARVVAAEKKFKITLESGSQYVIRLDRDEFYWIDPKRRTYQVMKLSDLERTAKDVGKQMQTALSKMKNEIEKLPPEQRALVEQMIGQREEGVATGAVQVRATGVEKTIAGYRCREYVVEVSGKEHLRACTTEEIAAFENLRSDWWKLQQRTAQWVPLWGKDQFTAYNRVPGFPLETQMAGMRALIRKVESVTPPPSEFELPAGYERRPAPALPGIQR